MAKREDVRRIALALPGTLEVPHMDRVAFRVARIYATMPPDGLTANLKFSAEEQEFKCLLAPQAFAPVPGGWGRMGMTTITLAAVSLAELEAALRTAHAHALPKPKPPRRRIGKAP